MFRRNSNSLPLLPFGLSALVILADQLTKALIVRNIPLFYQSGFAIEVLGEFLRIIHTRNLGMALSLGSTLPPVARFLVLVVLSSIMLFWLIVGLYRAAETTTAQRWFLALILGGGVGNLIDRIARPSGVVDFIDVKFYGILGFDRFPTFNVADSAITVGALLTLISLIPWRGDRGSGSNDHTDQAVEPES